MITLSQTPVVMARMKMKAITTSEDSQSSRFVGHDTLLASALTPAKYSCVLLSLLICFILHCWQGRRESNPHRRFWRPLHCHCATTLKIGAKTLLGFLVGRALTAAGAELHLLETLSSRLFITSRGVVTALALGARQNREITHFSSLLSVLYDLEPTRRPDRPLSAGADGQASHRRP